MVGNKPNRQELPEFDKIWLAKCKKFKSFKCITVQLSAQPHVEESGAGTMQSSMLTFLHGSIQTLKNVY
jgi:hypothetical protein